MTFWRRALATLVTMLMASALAGFIWHAAFDARIPSYLSGVIGGITALVIWELLRRE